MNSTDGTPSVRRRTGRPLARCPDWVLFQRPPVRTRRASCPGNGLSSDCYVSVMAGCGSWMPSWQGGHTINVLRRILAIWCAHIGCGRPGVVRLASLDTRCTCTWDRCSHSSHRPTRRRASSSLPWRRPVTGAGRRSSRTAFFCRAAWAVGRPARARPGPHRRPAGTAAARGVPFRRRPASCGLRRAGNGSAPSACSGRFPARWRACRRPGSRPRPPSALLRRSVRPHRPSPGRVRSTKAEPSGPRTRTGARRRAPKSRRCGSTGYAGRPATSRTIRVPRRDLLFGEVVTMPCRVNQSRFDVQEQRLVRAFRQQRRELGDHSVVNACQSGGRAVRFVGRDRRRRSRQTLEEGVITNSLRYGRPGPRRTLT